MIKVAGELYDSLANGPGLRYVLFTQGCHMGCPGCHNKHTWNPDEGMYMSNDSIMNHINHSPFISGVTLSGGDPMEQSQATYEICKTIKEQRPDLDILIYSGRTLEKLRTEDDIYISKILDIADYLAEGAFIEELKDCSKLYLGSSNQRIMDLKNNKEIIF